jgi:glycosyltransferase involved in cell wall biosynthesis
MKILHVSYFDNQGGAAIAALRIVKAQRKYGIDAKMLVVSKKTDLEYVTAISKFKMFYNKLANKISPIIISQLNKSANPILHSINLFGCGLYKQINKTDYDIIHLHWINGEMLSIKEISKIQKPIVWTLHDSWAFCGAEHHPNGIDDILYSKNYLPRKYKGFNLNRWVLKRKKRCWKNKKFHIVTPSTWETESAKNSILFYNIVTIPCCLNENIFKPIDKNIAKDILNLDRNKKYILFGAIDINNPIKGGDLLFLILNAYIKQYKIDNVDILIFGSSYGQFFSYLGLPVHYLGQIHDEYTMSLIYNATNIMLVPSRMESFGQVASESLACGVPVVCFDIGGLTDIIDHKENGYIATRFDVEDFVQGINWILNEADYSILSKKAREKALINYNEKKCADSYLSVYNDILKNN